MHGCFRAGNNQVMIEFGKPNCQLPDVRKICSFLNLFQEVYPGGWTLRGIHWLVHLVLLQCWAGPWAARMGSTWESSSIWGKWQVREVTDVEGSKATDVAFRDQLVALRLSLWQGWDPGKSGHLSTGSRSKVPVTLGLKLSKCSASGTLRQEVAWFP